MKLILQSLGPLLLSSACAFGPAGADATRPLQPDGAVQLNVTNTAGGPMEIYALGSGTVYRVGTVQPGMEGRFTVRPGLAVSGPIELVARANNGPVIHSGPILLAPGDVVDFALATHASLSTATVRARSAGGR